MMFSFLVIAKMNIGRIIRPEERLDHGVHQERGKIIFKNLFGSLQYQLGFCLTNEANFLKNKLVAQFARFGT